MPIETLARDLRLALRQLRGSPLFTAAAVATLAGGIGANPAMFTVVESVLLRPPAYREPDRLAVFDERLSGAEVADLQRDARSFSAIGAYSNVSVTLTGSGGEPERVAGASGSGNWFELLGPRPAAGARRHVHARRRARRPPRGGARRRALAAALRRRSRRDRPRRPHQRREPHRDRSDAGRSR